MQKFITIVFTVFFLFSCSTKSGLTEISAGPAEKESMLVTLIDKYNKAVYWSSASELTGYVDPLYQKDFFKRIANRGEDEDLVESKVKNTDFYDNSGKAIAYIETRFFNKTTLYVSSRYEKLDWEYHRLDGGWRLNNITELSAEHFAHLISE